MLKNSILILITALIAIGGGAASLSYALKAQEGVGAIAVGSWVAFPDIGTPDADPYTKARVSREGVLALGRAEGLSFIAEKDASGNILRQECAYVIEGKVPTSRFWTLYAADRSLTAITSEGAGASALHSYGILRGDGDTFSVTAGRKPAAGNWLAVHGNGQMYFVLTLYDTPVASSTGLSGIQLPRIVRTACNA